MNELRAVLALFLVAITCAKAESPWKMIGLNGGGAMYSIASSPHDPKVILVSSDMSGVFRSEDGGRTWTMIHHRYVRGNTKCKPFFDRANPGHIYFPARGGSKVIKRSTDNGKTWSVLSQGPWRSRIRFIHKIGNQLYIGDESSLWLSGGQDKKWQRLAGVTGRTFNICQQGKSVVIGTTTGVFTQTNGKLACVTKALGETFTGFTGNAKVLYAAIPCVLNGKTLEGGIYRSKNYGRTWERIMNPKVNTQTQRSSRWANGDLPQYRFLMTTDTAPDRIYAYCTGTSYYPPNHSTIYRSDDAGDSWRACWFSDPRFKKAYNVEDDRLTLSRGQRYQYPPISLSINPTNPDHLAMSTDMTLFFSTNGGRDWYASQSKLIRTFGKSRAWPGTGLGVTTTWHYKIDPFESHRHYICYTDVGFARSLDAGRTWIWEGHRLPWNNTVYEIAFDPAVKGKVWGAFSQTHDIPNYNVIGNSHMVHMNGGVAVSLDHGATWKKLSLPPAPCTSVVLDPRSPVGKRTLHASLFELGVCRSTDDGRSWKSCSKGLGTSKNRRACRLVLHSDGTLFCLVTAKRWKNGRYDAEAPGLYRQRRDLSWQKITSTLPLHWPKDFDVNPWNSNDILLGASDVRGHTEGGLYRTLDGGESWKLVARKEREHFGGYFHPTKKGRIYMTLTEGAEKCGLYLSRDNGATWSPFNELPFSNIHRVHFDKRRTDEIILTTFGASILQGPDSPPRGK